MKRLALGLTALAAAALPLHSAFAAPGGGTGTNPPPPPVVDTRAAFTLNVQGWVTGAPDGNKSLIFRLFEQDPGCDVGTAVSCPATPALFEETKDVSMYGQWFATALGSTVDGGLSPSLFAGKQRLQVRWYAPSAPTVALGTLQVGSAPYAWTMVPGAVVQTNLSFTPALELGNSAGPALRARVTAGAGNALRSLGGVHVATQSATGIALDAVSSAASGSGAGLVAAVSSPLGTALSIHDAEVWSVTGRNAVDGEDVFRVSYSGAVQVKGRTLPRKGPDGTPGQNGSNGAAGASPSASSQTLCTVTSSGSCGNICRGGSWLLGSVSAPCLVAASTGSCLRSESTGSCCVCSSTRF